MADGFIVRRGGKGDLVPSIFIEPGLIVEFFGLIGNIPPG